MNTPYGWNRYIYYDIPSSIGEFLRFNVSNELRMRDVGVYPFCHRMKKLIRGSEISDQQTTYDVTYEFNDKNQVVKSKALQTREGEILGIHTRAYYYDCD